MAEPEELILEGAHFATRVARDVVAALRDARPGHIDSPLARRPRPPRDVPDGPLRDAHPDRAHGAAGTGELARRASRAGPRTQPRRRTLLLRHRRTTRLSAAGGAATTGGLDAIALYRLLAVRTGRAAGARHAAGVRARSQAPRRETGSCSRKRRRSIAGSPPRSRARARAGRGACACARTPRGRHASDAGHADRSAGPGAPRRRSAGAAVPLDARRLGRRLARLGAAAIGCAMPAAGIGGLSLPWYWGGCLRSRSRLGISRSRQAEDGDGAASGARSRVFGDAPPAARAGSGRGRGRQQLGHLGHPRRRAAGERRGPVRPAAANRS